MKGLITRWTDRPLRSKSLVIIALPLSVLLISLVLVYVTERQTSRVEDDVRRALRVQGDVQAVHSLLAEAAASVRGYLLIQRSDFLPSYRSALERIDSTLRRLDTDIRDPQMRGSLERLRPLIVIKLEGLEQLKALASSDDRAAMTRILVDNKHVLDALRQEIQQMLEREQTLLDERNAEASAVRSRMLLATGLAAMFGVLGALFAVVLLSTGIVHRVQQVERNARRLALGQPLIPQGPAADEIGQLAASLEEAGQLLAERERALRDNEERLRLIIDGVKEYGIFGLDPSGHVTSWNTGAERIKGYSEADILGRHFSLFYPPQARDTAPYLALQAATREGRYEEEAWRQRRDGSLFWANVVITAQRDASGTLRGFSKITRGTTARGQRHRPAGATAARAVHRRQPVQPGADRDPAGALATGAGDLGHAGPARSRPGLAAPPRGDPAGSRPARPLGPGSAQAPASEPQQQRYPRAADHRRRRRRHLARPAAGRRHRGAEQTPARADLSRRSAPASGCRHAHPASRSLTMNHPAPADDFRILVIDDQPANLELVEQLLAREGLHNVLSCTDPAQALALFSSFEPDLLILDLHMPGLDGFAVLEQLQRRIPADDYLPILVLTADATREARLRALALGARDFISKPLDAIETLLRVWNLLETRALYRQLRRLQPDQQPLRARPMALGNSS